MKRERKGIRRPDGSEAWLRTSMRDELLPDWLIDLVVENFGFHQERTRPALFESVEDDLWRLRRQQQIESLIYKTYR